MNTYRVSDFEHGTNLSGQLPRGDGRQLITITLDAEAAHALEAITTPGNRSAFVERAIRRELTLGTSENVARPTMKSSITVFEKWFFRSSI